MECFKPPMLRPPRGVWECPFCEKPPATPSPTTPGSKVVTMHTIGHVSRVLYLDDLDDDSDDCKPPPRKCTPKSNKKAAVRTAARPVKSPTRQVKTVVRRSDGTAVASAPPKPRDTPTRAAVKKESGSKLTPKSSKPKASRGINPKVMLTPLQMTPTGSSKLRTPVKLRKLSTPKSPIKSSLKTCHGPLPHEVRAAG